MPFTTNTPYMGLTLPIPTQELGPAWAVELNAALTLVDSHNHSPGFGAPIVAASLNINSDLPINGNNLTLIRSVRFLNQSSPLSLPTDIGCLYISGGNFYYNNLSGQQVQITSGNSLNAASIGGIGGDYVTSGALVAYTSSISSYSMTTNGSDFANLLTGATKIFRTGTHDFGVTLQAPGSLGASYILTLPTALPAAQTALSVTSSGQIQAGITGGTIADVIPNYGLIPTGAFIPYGGVNAPAGYLLCDGTSYLISTYPALAAALFDSTTGLYAFGSADGLHFNVPDLRGQFIRGVSGTSGNDPDASSRSTNNPNGNIGNNVGSQQGDQFRQHVHNERFASGGAGTGIQQVSGSVPVNTAINTDVAGGNETRPINTYATYIIKT